MEASSVMYGEDMKHRVTYSFTFLCRNIRAHKSSFPAFFNPQCTQELCLFSSKAHVSSKIMLLYLSISTSLELYQTLTNNISTTLI